MGLDRNGSVMDTQRKVILNYMLDGNVVSQMEVIRKFGFTRLSSIIYDLKEKLEREGNQYFIKDRTVIGTNRYGNDCRFKEYWIEDINGN